MLSIRSPRVALIATAIVLAGCNDAPTAPRGTVILAVTTTGMRPDPDGYLVRVDSVVSRSVPVNGSVTFDDLAPGRHVMTMSGAAVNCALAADSIVVEVTPGASTRVDLAVTCPRVLSSEILFASEEFGFSEILAMKPDGTGRERLTGDQLVNTMPTVSPDGRYIAFASRRSGAWGGIYIMNVDSTDVRLLAGRATFEGSPVWSPDGATIAFRSNHEGPYGNYGRIWLVNADGTGLRPLTTDTDTAAYSFDDNPTWSPDSREVAFERSGDLYVINADGTGLALLIDCSLGCSEPAWSPDGQRIVYTASTDLDGDRVADTHYDIYVMNVDGTNVRRLTSDPAQEGGAVWSPDGTEIIFARVEDGKFQLYRMSADGGPAVRLSVPGRSDFVAEWVRPHQW